LKHSRHRSAIVPYPRYPKALLDPDAGQHRAGDRRYHQPVAEADHHQRTDDPQRVGVLAGRPGGNQHADDGDDRSGGDQLGAAPGGDPGGGDRRDGEHRPGRT
jgi:hypothetical protein